jgi:hypothetical protein
MVHLHWNPANRSWSRFRWQFLLLPLLLLNGDCSGQETRTDLPQLSLSLTAFPVQVDLEGSDSSRLRATLLRFDGALVANTEIVFSTNEGVLGDEREPTIRRLTARDGIVEIDLRGAGTAGVATVRATSGNAMAFAEIIIH